MFLFIEELLNEVKLLKLELFDIVFGVSSVIEEILWGIGIFVMKFWFIYNCDLLDVMLIVESVVLFMVMCLILLDFNVILRLVCVEG